jgi:hypothetical protein
MTPDVTITHRSIDRLHATALDGALALYAGRVAPLTWQHTLTLDGLTVSPKNDEAFYARVRQHLNKLPKGASAFATAYLRAFEALAVVVAEARRKELAERAMTPVPTIPLQGAQFTMTGGKQP